MEFTADGAPLGLLGPSGSGKTMTLRAIAGLETPDRGRIVLHGRVLFDSEQRINVPARERRIGLLFQNYALFPHLTVAENIAFGLRRLSAQERNRRVATATRRRASDGWRTGIPPRFPAASSSAWRWRARWPSSRRHCCSTNRFPRWIRICAARSNGNFAKRWAAIRDRRLRQPQSRRGLPRLRRARGAGRRKRGGAQARKKKSSAIRQRSKLRGSPDARIFRARAAPPTDAIEALDWGCTLRVAQEFAKPPGARRDSRASHSRAPGWIAAV